MLIGELSQRTGLSRDTIRFYEKQGLIKVGRRERRVNNYKEYSDSVLRRLMLFKKIKSYGFTLNESAEIISLLDANLASCGIIEKMSGEKIAVIDKKIAELNELKNLIRSGVNSCLNGCAPKTEDSNCSLFNL
jgi:DNA-binding transcriptional MerR regulator